MSQEENWKECLEDFLVGADGDYDHSEVGVIHQGKGAVEHTLFAKKEILSWKIDNKTNEIVEVKHVGR